MICETDDMAVYINDQNDEFSEMVSVTTGQLYADLPTAYDYHGESEFRRCNWNAYVAKLVQLTAARKRLKQLQDVEIPLPDIRSEEDVTDVVENSNIHFRPDTPPFIRLVGPLFIPDVDNAIFGGCATN